MVERSYERFPASLPGALLSYNHGSHIIRSVDLSRNGCRIANTVQVVPGMNIALFLIPLGDERLILIQDAMVRWCGAAGIGIEFQVVAEQYRDRLDALINQLKKSH